MAIGGLAQFVSYARVQEPDQSRWLMVRETGPIDPPRPRLQRG